MTAMKLFKITQEHHDDFRLLLTRYYREGEDAGTPQAEMDDFISYLFSMCTDGTIEGCIAYADRPVGFVIWNIDTADSPFSNWPGRGTILEIGVIPESRKTGLGRMLAAHAEDKMLKAGITSFYVCAYGPAVEFWKKCGYEKTDRIADNDLPIYAKDL